MTTLSRFYFLPVDYTVYTVVSNTLVKYIA